MSWVFILAMNGYAIEVDRFATERECLEKTITYRKAFKQSGTRALVWCEHKPQA